MKTFIIISTIIFLASFITLVVYLILTLIEIKRAAKQMQKVFEKVDKNIDGVTKFSTKVFSTVNTVLPIVFSMVGIVSSRLVKLLKSLFFGGGKKWMGKMIQIVF